MPQKFSQQLHQAAEPLWQKSIHHPFIQEMASGKLPINAFRYYLTQDTKYLTAFGKLHQRTAALLPKAQGQLLIKLSEGSGEEAYRDPMLEQLSLTPEKIAKVPIAPTNYAYITHMEHQLSVSAPAAVTGLLPCYWLYDEIGAYWQYQASPVPIYQSFFEGYRADSFDVSTRQLIDLIDQLAEKADNQTRQQMMTAFLRSSNYELAFWQMAYQHETWQDLGN